MKDFFLMLLFSKIILLTPDPITLIGEVELTPDKPIKAITSGASVLIDLSLTFDFLGAKKSGSISSLDILEKKFPPGSVSATLYSEDGQKILLNDINFLLSNESAEISISTKSEVPKRVEVPQTCC